MPHGLIRDDTYVLVGFYKSAAHLDWIKRRKYYKFRMKKERVALILTKEALLSKHLLLHGPGEENSGELWKIVGKGFRVVAKATLLRFMYPSPKRHSYLVVKIE